MDLRIAVDTKIALSNFVTAASVLSTLDVNLKSKSIIFDVFERKAFDQGKSSQKINCTVNGMVFN